MAHLTLEQRYQIQTYSENLNDTQIDTKLGVHKLTVSREEHFINICVGKDVNTTKGVLPIVEELMKISMDSSDNFSLKNMASRR